VTRAVSLLTGTPGVPGTTLGAANFAKLNQPHRLARAAGNLLVAADSGNNRLVVVDRAGAITNVLNATTASVWCGRSDDPQASSATQLIPMVSPVGVALGSDGGVYASEVVSADIRKIPGTGLLAPPPLPYLHLFRSPLGIALDTSGAQLYIADAISNAVQVLHLGNNQTETFLDASAGIFQPVDVVVDATNNVYVLNQGTGGNGSILQFDQFGNLLRTNAAGLAMPTALAVDSFGNVFVAEQGGAVQQFNSGSSNTLFTITQAGVQLEGIALFSDGTIALSDAGNHVIWQVNPVTRAVSLLTGTPGVPGTTLGAANFAKLNQPYRLARAAGNLLVAADSGNNRLVVVSRDGSITNVINSTIASVWYGRSDDSQASSATQLIPMVSPVGVALDSDGGVYASEVVNKDIRKIPGTGLLPPPPLPYLHLFGSPLGIAENWSGSKLYIADLGSNAVQVLNLGNNQTETFLDASAGILNPVDVVVDYSNHVHVLNQGTGGNGSVLEFNEFGNLLGTNASGLAMPTALALDDSGNVFIAEPGGVVEQFHSGVSNSHFTITNAGVQIEGIALFDDGTIAVSDAGNHVIWQVNPATKAATLLTGILGVPGTTLGLASFAKLNQPYRLARAAGNLLVAADYGNNRLVVVDRDGSITDVLNSTNASVWYGRSDDPQASSGTQLIPMVSPVGVVVGIDGGVYASEAAYYDIRKITGTGLVPPPPPPPPVPVPAPAIGWVDYTIPPAELVSVLQTDAPFIFNNDVTIAIAGTAGAETLFTFGPTGGYIPYPDATTGGTPPFYRDGMLPSQVPLSIILPPQPDVTVKAIGVAPGRPSSDLVTARFQFKTANPVVVGNNAAMFNVTDQTVGAEMWYTIDGTDPTNAAPSFGPITGVASLSLSVSSNLTFRVRAFRANYQSSGIVTTFFSATNFAPNSISFGFASGEASSEFIASPGQTFYAPVTLNPVEGTKIYSLQFNLTVTNGGWNPGPALAPGAYSFQSLLEKPIPGTTPPVYERIPPLMFSAYSLNPPPPEQITTFDGLPFVNMVFTNSALNLLGVGWLERAGSTNLYDTTVQTLISFSQAHDTLFTPAMGKVVLGGYAFQIPPSATSGQTYQIQIGRPSATSDGVGTPGSDIYIATPTTGSLTNGTLNSIKIVTTGQRKYVAGDCAPFGWFNAGDFGNTNLDNSDVMQVFQSAIYSLNYPPPGSDFYDSMDSCGGFGGLDPSTGYLTNAGPLSLAQQNGLFDGDDTLINQIAFGNSPQVDLDVCDIYVTFRRSLDPSLTWYRRFWTNGVLAAEAVAQTNLQAQAKTLLQSKLSLSFLTNPPSVNFAAADFIASPGQTLQVPLTANIFGDYPLRVLMLNLSVEPLDGSPALTSPIQFKPNAALGAAAMSAAVGNGNYAGTWLNNAIAGLTGTATLGTLTVTIPANAPSSAAYAIHFDHASASPNGIASFPSQTRTGLILLSDRSSSSYGDEIPDAWRLRYFGTVNNILSLAAANADGDGANNWQEYVAGTDPTDPNSVLRVSTGQAVAETSQDCVVQWPSVAGKSYIIERSASVFGPNWIPVSTNTGSGTDMVFHDSSGGAVRFYRVRVDP
jgi:sugar lactone lactonase YvrE